MTHVPTDRVPLLALLALLPVAAFLAWRGGPEVGLSVACVLLIAWSLRRMFAGEASEPDATA